ncbi:hypothetical protein C8J56DRAFT_1166374 [Mycena floridula]|nr:hypothetical protein C8J56DRAFT_1166374 [Mycena floridula]
MFLSLCINLFLSALELTSVSTAALPTIARALDSTEFVWIDSAYAMVPTALTLERRCSRGIRSTACFIGLYRTMMISGRTVQGSSGPGFVGRSYFLCVSLRHNLEYREPCHLETLLVSVFNFHQIRMSPIDAIAVIIVLASMRLPTPSGIFYQKLKQIVAIFWLSSEQPHARLVLSGVQTPWASARIIAPLVVGFCAFVTFVFYKAKYARQPIVPLYCSPIERV